MSLDQFTQTKLNLSGAWLPGDTTDPVFPIGDGYRHDHQREMYDSVQNQDYDVVLNTNPTGGGKTLSWAAPVIRSDEFRTDPFVVIATYPTAALVQDQQSTLLDLFRTYYGSTSSKWASARDFDLAVTLDGEEVLTDGTREFPLKERVQSITAATTTGESTGEVWADATQKASRAQLAGVPTVLLTTPDTVTLMAANRFHNRGEIAGVLGAVDMVVVDEFHLSNPRGKRLLPFHLDTYLSIGDTELEKLVFLSATPVAEDINRLQRAFNVKTVTNEVHASDLNIPNWKVMPEAELGITSRPMFSTGHWLETKVDEILDLHESPGQTLIVMDSIQEVEVLSEAIQRKTSLSVGRVYGWKKEGRQEAINNSDILIGNTAVEVGVDFQNVNRLICTAYDPNSALQRVGRMRARSQFSDYKILLISAPAVQTQALSKSSQQNLTRTEFDEVLHEALSEKVDRPYYDSLCGAYTRFLFNDANQPLKNEFRPSEAPEYKQLAYNHFGDSLQGLFPGAGTDVESFWQYLRVLQEKYSTNYNDYPIFEEMHSFRDSSLSCLVIDATDPEEPLKRYSLHHILRYRNGSVIEEDRVNAVFKRQFGREPTDDEQWFIDESQQYTCASFIVTGKRDDPRSYSLRDYRFEASNRKQWKTSSGPCLPDTMNDPSITVDPIVDGMEHLSLDDADILAQYYPASVTETHVQFHLGPYAATCSISEDETLLLWQDAILAHSLLMQQQLKKTKQTQKQSPKQTP